MSQLSLSPFMCILGIEQVSCCTSGVFIVSGLNVYRLFLSLFSEKYKHLHNVYIVLGI